MPQRDIKDLKKGDIVFAPAFSKDKGIGYACWCKITDISNVNVFNTTNSRSGSFKKITCEPQSGKLKGEPIDLIWDDSGKATIPNKPWKIVRIYNILFKE